MFSTPGVVCARQCAEDPILLGRLDNPVTDHHHLLVCQHSTQAIKQTREQSTNEHQLHQIHYTRSLWPIIGGVLLSGCKIYE